MPLLQNLHLAIEMHAVNGGGSFPYLNPPLRRVRANDGWYKQTTGPIHQPTLGRKSVAFLAPVIGLQFGADCCR